ncbi:retrotransposon protein, putative, ty1-copia subclass [Tanacetum coccineum]
MDGAVYVFKARLVVKGFTQTYGVDYEETLSPVANIRAIRILIAIAAYHDYEIWQMDVKIAFLNGHLFEEVYMKQPEGFVDPKYPNHKFGFTQSRDEPCVYLKASKSYIAILILYVDDILLMGNNIPMLQDVKSYLRKCFAMKEFSAYIEKILKRYSMENSKRGTIPMQEKLTLSKSQGASTPAEIQRMQKIPYASAVGSIMYAVRCTRPDVAFAQNMTSRFQQNLGEIHWTTVKNILKYLRNTKDMFLVYDGNMERELKVSCYTDVGYLMDADTLRSQTGYVFVLNGGAEAVWIRKFISGLGIVPIIEEPISMYCDNTGAIGTAKDHGITKGARHFRAKVHYLRDTIEMGDVKIEKVDTEDNLADPFTKALTYPKHSKLTKNVGLIPASSFIRKVVAAIAILPESDCYRDHSLAGMLLHPPQIAGKVIERLIKPAIIDDTPKLNDNDDEDSESDFDEHENMSFKVCGLLPHFCLKGSIGLLNPVPGLSVRTKMPVSSSNRRRAASSSAKSQESSSDVEQSSAAASHRDNSEYCQPHVASYVSLAGTHPDVCVHNDTNLYSGAMHIVADYQQCTSTKGVSHGTICINQEPHVRAPDPPGYICISHLLPLLQQLQNP